MAWSFRRLTGTPAVSAAAGAWPMAVTIAPAALLMGMAFPIGLRIWARSGGRDAHGDFSRDLGAAYALRAAGRYTIVARYANVDPRGWAGELASAAASSNASAGLTRPEASGRSRVRATCGSTLRSA